MSVTRRTIRTIPAVAGLLAVTASSAAALQPLFMWTGTVDREVLLVMSGRNVYTRGTDAHLPSNSRVSGQIPRNNRSGDVQVRLENGRGTVDVIEQPSARNNYQTVVRIRDPRAGADRYRVVAYWTGDSSAYDGRGENGDGRNDRDDDDRYDRGRDRDADRRRDHDDDHADRKRDRDDDRADRKRDRVDDRGDKSNGNGRGGGWGRGGNRNRGNYPDNGRGNDRNNGGWDNNGGNNSGYGPGALRWSGSVDDVVEITIQGRRVNERTRSGSGSTDVRSNVSGGGLPPRDGHVSLVGGRGRGTVQVVQQPSQYNGYTAVIRVSDPRAGASSYEFEARW